jgi:alpha-beta hydrolase superfamily lysophospholipase
MSGPDHFDILLRIHGAEALGREYVFVRLARMNIAGHLDYSEISRVLQQIRRRSDWFAVWMEASERHQALAATAEAMEAWVSAGDGYLRASLCAHWASFYASPELKSVAHHKSVELYTSGMDWYQPPSRRVEIPFGDDVLPAYLRSYGDRSDAVVLMLGGADTNKEELHHWGTQIARRGMTVVAVDGPGQGEHAGRYGRLKMHLDDYHQAVSAAIDWVLAEGVAGASPRIGVFGNSLGGYLALDAAMRDNRIAAVISNGGFCDGASISRWPDGVMNAFASCLGMDDLDQVRQHVVKHLNLERVQGDHRPPALVVHGGREDLSDEEESRRAAALVDGTLVVVTDAWHTCTNRDHVAAPMFADWLARALHGQVAGGFQEVRLDDERDYGRVFTR